VPRISLILRKAYGGAYIVMDSQSIGADLTYAWPTNEIAVMGAEGAARHLPPSDRRRRGSRGHAGPHVKEYKAELMHPYYAAERGLVDDVIDPAPDPRGLIESLAMLRTSTPTCVAQARQPAAVTEHPVVKQDARCVRARR